MSYTRPTPISHSPFALLTTPQPPSTFYDRFVYNIHLHKSIARSVRSSLRLTAHARHRAAALGLSVDTAKAVKCDPRQVSNVPLPILDTDPSPVELEWIHEDAQSVERMVEEGEREAMSSASDSTDASSSSESSERSAFSDSEDEQDELEEDMRWDDEDASEDASRDATVQELPLLHLGHLPSNVSPSTTHQRLVDASEIARPMHRPALRCIIPSDASASFKSSPDTNVSSESEYSSITLTCVSVHSHVPILVTENEQAMAREVPTVIQLEEEVRESQPSVYRYTSGKRLLDVPSDASHRMSWGCGEMAEVEPEIDTEMDITSSSSCSGTSSSDSGPTTPEDAPLVHCPLPTLKHQPTTNHITIHIKRTYSTDVHTTFPLPFTTNGPDVSSDIADSNYLGVATMGQGTYRFERSLDVEKHPKFERKEWVRPYTKRAVSSARRYSPMRRHVSGQNSVA